MCDAFFGMRISSDELKKIVYQKQAEAGLSNDAMCIILRDLIGEFEAKRSNDYARLILALAEENDKIKGGGVDNGGTDNKTIS